MPFATLGANNRTLYTIWDERRRSTRVYSEIARAWVRLLIEVQFYLGITGLIATPFTMRQFNGTAIALAYLGNLVHLAVLVQVRRLVNGFYRTTLNPLGDSDAIVPASPTKEAQVREYLDPAARKLGIDPARLRLYVDRDDYGNGPRMVESKGEIHVILPLGFSPFVRQQPAAAAAMLAHELGHAAQRDTASWVYATAFSSFVFRWMVPVFTFSLLLVGVRQLVASQKIPVNTETGVVWVDTPSPLEYLVFVVFIGFLMGSYFLIRKGRRVSEEMADLAAMIAASPDGLAQALGASTGASSSRAAFQFHSDADGFPPIHPSREFRLRQVERYRALLPGSAPPPTDDDSKGGELARRRIRQSIRILVWTILAYAGWLAFVFASYTFRRDDSVPLGYGPIHAVVTTIAGASLVLGLLWLIFGLLTEKPVPRTRQGVLLMMVSPLLGLLYTGVVYVGIWHDAEWLLSVVPFLAIAAFSTFVIGLVWLLIAWLGREVR